MAKKKQILHPTHASCTTRALDPSNGLGSPFFSIPQTQPQRHWGSMTSVEQSRQTECLALTPKDCKEWPLGDSDAGCYGEIKIEGDGPYTLRIHMYGGGKIYSWQIRFYQQTTRVNCHRIMPQGMGHRGCFQGSTVFSWPPERYNKPTTLRYKEAKASGPTHPILELTSLTISKKAPTAFLLPLHLPASSTTAGASGTELNCNSNA